MDKINALLDDINVWKRHENNAISNRAVKLTKYLEAFQDGNLDSSKLTELIQNLDVIEKSAKNSDEVKIVKDINKIASRIIKSVG